MRVWGHELKGAHHGATSSTTSKTTKFLREAMPAWWSDRIEEDARSEQRLQESPPPNVKIGTQAWNNYDANTPRRSKSPSTTPRRTPRLEQKHSHLHPAASATAMRSNSPRPLAKRNDKATNQAKAATQRKAATISIERVAAMERAFQAKSAEALT